MAGPLNVESANGYSAEGSNGRRWKKVVDFTEAKVQIWFAVPMVLCNVFYFSITLISVMFAGHLGDVELAASTLANSWAIVSGFAFMTGLSGALETLCGQGFGAKMYNKLGIYLQASCIISFFFSIIISIIWVFTEPILVFLHQDPEISRIAALYMKHLIPGLFAYGFLQNILIFLQTQSIVLPLVVLSIIPLGIHFGIVYSLVNKTSLGFKGAAMAASISIWISFLSLAILDFWAFEILVFLAGLMPNPEITTSLMAICVNTVDIADMITYGLSAAVSTRVSNELGAGNPNRAKHATTVTLKLSVLVSLAIVLTKFLKILDERSIMADGGVASPFFRNDADKIAFAVHGAFHSSGFFLTAVGLDALADNVIDSKSTNKVGIDNWNQFEDHYAFVYANPLKGCSKVLVKCLVINGKLLVNALARGSSQPVHLEIDIRNYVQENVAGYDLDVYKNFDELMSSLHREIISELYGSSNNPSWVDFGGILQP
ncbi:hypothetical protein GQ457_11G013530 [Hibiscus cannabinus]